MLNSVYILRNAVNDKVYVGQTWQTLRNRWRDGKGYKGCVKLTNAINAIGKENFHYEVLILTTSQSVADYWEQYFIKKFDSIENGYNICVGGGSAMFGRKHSNASKVKMSKAKIGKAITEQTKRKMSAAQTGIKNHNYGKTHDEETKKKISEAGKLQQVGENNGFAKLSDSDVLEIKKLLKLKKAKLLKITMQDIGKLYGISKYTVKDIARNRSWTHIQ